MKSVRHGAQDWLPQLGETARELAGGLPGNGGGALAERVRRLPIQRSIDIAVPLELAWDEWTRLDSLPEGTHHVEEIERDGDGRLTGRVSGIRLDSDWEADVLDEREDESFAWRSVHGSDCAGLVTFHRLGPRLTRLELQLDVVPRRVAEAVALLLHLADRRADADLKRFKARLETINPDEYPEPDDDEAPGEGEEE